VSPGETVLLGDREVARIGLGTNRLTHTDEHVAFVESAVAAGVGMIDTAHLYASGESELTIGDALEGRRGAAVVATKGGFKPGEGRPQVLQAQIEESLRRLRTEEIELYYLHKVDPETPLEQSLEVIADYQSRGKIRHVGLSNVEVEHVERARELVTVAAVQNRYNLSERGHEDVLEYCTREEIVFVPYFPLKGDAPPALGEIADQRGATPAQIALAWLLSRSPLVLPIAGSLSIEHVRENLDALRIELSEAELRALR
jgi:aryl-alcohol dehydrogenase-like predicted oxidoreductase